MSRQTFEIAFRRLAADILPPGLELKYINGVVLHPLINVEGGWDNSVTVFGITTPEAVGKSLVVRVSPKTEELLAANNKESLVFLKADLKEAIRLWIFHGVPHEHAFTHVVTL